MFMLTHPKFCAPIQMLALMYPCYNYGLKNMLTGAMVFNCSLVTFEQRLIGGTDPCAVNSNVLAFLSGFSLDPLKTVLAHSSCKLKTPELDFWCCSVLRAVDLEVGILWSVPWWGVCTDACL